MNFWQKLKEDIKGKPILVLAPMADVTDRAFRRVIAKYGKPDVMWTEFVSADGLFRGGYDSLINDLSFDEAERPIVAQFFTSKPEMMRKAAALAVTLGFDGVDINMGCPDKSVEKQGAGAALIKNTKLAQEIIAGAKQGILDAGGNIPVSVKTRIGYNKNELETWLPALLEAQPAMITIHARTRKEMSLVPARWEHVRRAVEIRNELKSDTLIFGNGDVTDVCDALEKAEETGCDGVMLGRAIFGNPFLFSSNGKEKRPERSEGQAGAEYRGGGVNYEQKLRVLIEHTKLFAELVQPKAPIGQSRLPSQCSGNGGQASLPSLGGEVTGGQGKSFAVMKKHFKAYVNGFDGAKELRMALMDQQDASGVERVIEDFLKNNPF